MIVCLGRYGLDQAYNAWIADRFDFVEVAFGVHNLVMLTCILVRRQHQALDKNLFHQVIALVAFFSGIFFVRAPVGSVGLLRLSQAVTLVAIGLGIASFVSLGRSFGILIAIRQVKTGGLYGVVRHPMYLTDIVWRVGIILKNPCATNFFIFVLSSACYVYRALLEEKFLAQYEEYAKYTEKVRYRFLPYLI